MPVSGEQWPEYFCIRTSFPWGLGLGTAPNPDKFQPFQVLLNVVTAKSLVAKVLDWDEEFGGSSPSVATIGSVQLEQGP